MIKESEMMLEWAAEQTVESTTTVVDLEFLPSETNVDIVAAAAHGANGSHE